MTSCMKLVDRPEILRTVPVWEQNAYHAVVLNNNVVSINEYHMDEALRIFVKRLYKDESGGVSMKLGGSFAKFMTVTHSAWKTCLIMLVSHAQYDDIG